MSHIDALWGFLVAAIISFVAAPLAARLARAIGAIDMPKERGLHDEPTPSLGGLAILAGIGVAGLLFLPLYGNAPVAEQTRGIAAGALVAALVGTADDIIDLPALLKLLGQIGAALIPVLSDVQVDSFTLPFIHHVALGHMAATITVLDGAFVVAKRIKYRRPVYEADRWHLHHRLTNIGFSQRRTVLYLYGWTLALAALALALRFVPYSDHHGHFHTGWTLVLIGFGLFA